MKAGLDMKRGFSKMSHARAYRKYAYQTLEIVKVLIPRCDDRHGLNNRCGQTTSDRARDVVANQESYDDQEERVASTAEAIYRSFFGYREAFPTPEQEESWASSVWTMACTKTGITISPAYNLADRVSSDWPPIPAVFRFE